MSIVLDADFVKRPTKAQKLAFDRRAREIIIAAGGVKQDEHKMYAFAVETTYGKLELSVHGTWVAGRFDDPRAPVDCNPYSGKWNFHTGLDHFERRLKEVLP